MLHYESKTRQICTGMHYVLTAPNLNKFIFIATIWLAMPLLVIILCRASCCCIAALCTRHETFWRAYYTSAANRGEQCSIYSALYSALDCNYCQWINHHPWCTTANPRANNSAPYLQVRTYDRPLRTYSSWHRYAVVAAADDDTTRGFFSVASGTPSSSLSSCSVVSGGVR